MKQPFKQCCVWVENGLRDRLACVWCRRHRLVYQLAVSIQVSHHAVIYLERQEFYLGNWSFRDLSSLFSQIQEANRSVQLMVITCVGFTSFAANNFWVSLFLQRVRGLSALEIAVQLLPQAIGGILVNIVIALVLHRVSNRLLMGVSVAAYTGAGLLLSFMGKESSYWAFLFPSLLLSVIGADVQFSVTNVSFPVSVQANLTQLHRCMSCLPSLAISSR